MTERVTMEEVRSRLSDLVTRAEGGEVIVISRRGQPVAKLVPVAVPATGPSTVERPGPRQLGLLRGRLSASAVRTDPGDPDVSTFYEGGPDDPLNWPSGGPPG